MRESHDEAQYLRRRHGAEAVAAARAKLTRPDLTRWGRSVLELAVKELGRPPRET